MQVSKETEYLGIQKEIKDSVEVIKSLNLI